jgi:hypothetical protein
MQGDFLIFQVESGYGLMRVLDVDESGPEPVWHIAVYRDLFPDVEMAEGVIGQGGTLQAEIPHIALTDRAFESTPVSKIANAPISPAETDAMAAWNGEVSDRSVRLMLGLR